jgi:shikimate dehydrogenase
LQVEDPEVRRIGAVNTILFSEGSLVGYNTDARGLLEALRTVVGFEPRAKRILILGSGGAARAAASAMTYAGACEVYVNSRSRDRARALAEAFDGEIGVCEQTGGLSVDLVINATTVGMKGGGAEGESPIELANLGACDVVYDMVYRPTLTPLLRTAQRLGVSAFDGRSMLAAQARFAFEHFFNILPSLDTFLEPLERDGTTND